MLAGSSGGGTGSALTKATVIVCGVASLIASATSFLSVWLQTKNYRKPLLQRYVIRILLMVPLYSASSWASIMSQDAAFYLDAVRDVYEAFTIYTFLQLLINFLGGERSLIIMMHGRPPISHPWPMKYCLPKIDISDPYTFLTIKRGILQYAWLKPLLAVASFVMKLTDTYQEGYLGVGSGYLWSGLIYNISITLCLYALAMFWACMSEDLKPFRPVPKFLCIKLIIFASYWQGFFLSILQKAGAITNRVPGYTADNLAAAIQDALICCEMPIFAVAHWYAFSWHDYADVTISAARMPVKYALRDAFGPQDLIQDTKETFGGQHYEYRVFDSGDNVIAHAESDSRVARMLAGMRYERGGKGKYWIPRPGEINAKTPLLPKPSTASTRRGTSTSSRIDSHREENVAELSIDAEDERLFNDAKAFDFGDWNYPVITAHVPSAETWQHAEPNMITPATNRHLFQPTAKNKERRRERSRSRRAESSVATRRSQSSESHESDDSQKVDLLVEDVKGEERERVRARKEGGSEWNEESNRRFVRPGESERT